MYIIRTQARNWKSSSEEGSTQGERIIFTFYEVSVNLFEPRCVSFPVAIRRISMYCYIWSFRVRPENVPAFRDAYGPEGGRSFLWRRNTSSDWL